MRLLHKVSAMLFAATLLVVGCDQPNSVQQEETDPALEQQAQQIEDRNGQPIEGQYIVVFNEDKSKMTAAQASQRINTMMSEYEIQSAAVKSQYRYSVKGFTAKLDDQQLTQLRNDKRVDFVEQDKIVMLSPPRAQDSFWCIYFGIGCDTGGGDPQTTPYGITRVGGATGGVSGTAWVIDTGVDLDHNDLNVDTQRSTSFVATESTADDGNGHGTHVAGTIAAIDNDIDVIGVAPGASVVGVKVLSSTGSGTTSGVIDGVDYVAQNASPGDVANMSLGGGTSTALDNAVANAASNGIYFALAAGNDGADANGSSPARVNGSNIYTISAIDSNDNFASFSNYGNPPVDYAAPGVDVKSLWKDGGVNTISGTSMASPHAAGVLLVTGGNPTADGTANGDPDGNPDPIIHN